MPASQSSSASSSRNASITSSDPHARPTFVSASASRTKNATPPNHSRNVSGSSLRQAINLPSRMDFIKGKGKVRKESISGPTPLAGPFDIDRVEKVVEEGVGQAI